MADASPRGKRRATLVRFPDRLIQPIADRYENLSLLPADLRRMRALGAVFGYPQCCIDAFVLDCAYGRYPGILRSTGSPGGWVPCWPCFRLWAVGADG